MPQRKISVLKWPVMITVLNNGISTVRLPDGAAASQASGEISVLEGVLADGSARRGIPGSLTPCML